MIVITALYSKGTLCFKLFKKVSSQVTPAIESGTSKRQARNGREAERDFGNGSGLVVGLHFEDCFVEFRATQSSVFLLREFPPVRTKYTTPFNLLRFGRNSPGKAKNRLWAFQDCSSTICTRSPAYRLGGMSPSGHIAALSPIDDTRGGLLSAGGHQ